MIIVSTLNVLGNLLLVSLMLFTKKRTIDEPRMNIEDEALLANITA